MNDVSSDFTWNMFKVSVLDCQRLGKGILHLKSLRVLKIHRSNLQDQHVRVLMQGLIKNETIEDLDLSHCYIGDQGALCIAKVVTVHPKLRVLTLCDNKIGCLGCEGLGFALLQPGCSLEKLNLKLNPLGEGGAMGMMRALVRETKLTELSMAACEYVDDAPLRTGQMLILNNSLKRLDITNNWFDDEGGEALVNGLSVNKTLEWLDIRETDISIQQYNQIQKYLQRNRSGLGEIAESVIEQIEVEQEMTLPEPVSEKHEKITHSHSELETAVTEE